MNNKKTVVISILGTTLDKGFNAGRWDRWRPNIALGQYPDLLMSRLELLSSTKHESLSRVVMADLKIVAPETTVRAHDLQLQNPWDFEEVYGALYDFAKNYPFDQDNEEYLVHITTGTHVAQICLFLLVESRLIPAKLLQSEPPARHEANSPGRFGIIDLDLSRYDRLAARFHQEAVGSINFLKSGIETKNKAFNSMMEKMEKVGAQSAAPILLTGPTGAGKSRLAKLLYQLRKERRLVAGEFVEVNCATLRGDAAMSTLFGHKKGAFTGASENRVGLLRQAHQGLLFLDEVGELGLDEQAMLLRAIEEKSFYPLGSDVESHSDFQLVCGTNRNLMRLAAQGRFREDLLARINLWIFNLPGLAERPEDIEPNLDYELAQYSRQSGQQVGFNKEAREKYLRLATGPHGAWRANFRDLAASVMRMSTLAPGGRISVGEVEGEWERLTRQWRELAGEGAEEKTETSPILGRLLQELDLFDRLQLEGVVKVCRRCKTLSEAGRVLFAQSRQNKARTNDADRLRKYLAGFGLCWADLESHSPKG